MRQSGIALGVDPDNLINEEDESNSAATTHVNFLPAPGTAATTSSENAVMADALIMSMLGVLFLLLVAFSVLLIMRRQRD